MLCWWIQLLRSWQFCIVILIKTTETAYRIHELERNEIKLDHTLKN